MAEVVPDANQEFWRPILNPTLVKSTLTASTVTGPTLAVCGLPLSGAAPEPRLTVIPPIELSKECSSCGSEFMIAARFCHKCGQRRTSAALDQIPSNDTPSTDPLAQAVALGTAGVDWAERAWKRISFPAWTRYLHFHEIKGWVGLPMGSMIAFFIGLGCMAGLIGVSMFYKASNLAEFQAIQMWRVQWLLSAIAAFVAGILLKGSAGE